MPMEIQKQLNKRVTQHPRGRGGRGGGRRREKGHTINELCVMVRSGQRTRHRQRSQ